VPPVVLVSVPLIFPDWAAVPVAVLGEAEGGWPGDVPAPLVVWAKALGGVARMSAAAPAAIMV
jgi:hypothetical protein